MRYVEPRNESFLGIACHGPNPEFCFEMLHSCLPCVYPSIRLGDALGCIMLTGLQNCSWGFADTRGHHLERPNPLRYHISRLFSIGTVALRWV